VADEKATKKATRKRTAKKATRGSSRRRPGSMPDLIYAEASPRSIGGVSMFDASTPITADQAVNYTSEEALIRVAEARLRAVGFDVLQVSATTINIAGPQERYEEVFGTSLFTEERDVIKQQATADSATFIDVRDADTPGLIDVTGTALADVLEGVAIEEPRYPMAPNAFAPLKNYWHLRVPGDVSLGCNADRAHRGGTTGRGIKVVMTDSGWYQHPYFTERGYKFQTALLGPGTSDAAADENGHGTAESANAFATAPDIDFRMVKMSFVNTIGSFNAAVGLAPHIITNSWGSSVVSGPLSAANQAMAAAIAAAVASGIVVVFASGNGHWGFPGQHPDVISVGGVYLEADGTMRASNYASGFASNVYPGRSVPDVCGLVGQRPRAAYIMLPLEPGCEIDQDLAGGSHPNGDETTGNDGWAAISGTSAAAPQIAGVCALIKQACPTLSPAAVRRILFQSARDVTTGTNNTGQTAGPGHDLATGPGLVDAHKAVLLAKLRCLRRPIGPIPIRPDIVEPVPPIVIGPNTPIRPDIVQPVPPIRPDIVRPIQPDPVRPIGPVIGPGPGPRPHDTDAGAGQAAPGSQGLSEDDLDALEAMILEDGGDLDL
jgi:subtilisin family serine protease